MAPALIAQTRAGAVGWLLLAVVGLAPAFADTIYLKEKKLLKGVVVEEHADRYVINTIAGEAPVFKSQIERIQFDDPEQGYYQLGRDLQRDGRLPEALKAYRKALDLRPDFHAAQQAAFVVQRMLDQDAEAGLADEIRRHGARTSSPRTVESRYGCQLGYDAGWSVIGDVAPETPAARAGLRSGDTVVAIWGEPIRYLTAEAISDQLRREDQELVLTIERSLRVPSAPPTAPPAAHPKGFSVELGYDGLAVTEVEPQGPADGLLIPSDLILQINGQASRYLSPKVVDGYLHDSTLLKLTIQRIVILRSDKA